MRMNILVSAYACEPDRGSEPGVGWNWARELARDHDVCVLTRVNNRDPIERELRRHPQPNLRFLYHDLPGVVQRWKRGQRGVHAYYYAWQLAARARVREAHDRRPFDLVHHLTFASAFSPALTWLPGVPFVWGPVGGGVRVPWRLVPEGGARAVVYEALRASRRMAGRYLDPFVRLTWRNADLILVQNVDTMSWLPGRHRSRARIQLNAGIDPAELLPRRNDPEGRFVVVAAGRLIPLKGFPLAIRAVARADDPRMHLVIAGDGPARAHLVRLAAELGLHDRVEFTGLLPRQALLKRLASADVLLFPSLHDESSLIVTEAMAQGAVPIVLDVGGPPSIVGDAGFVVPARGRDSNEVVLGLARALREASVPRRLEALREAGRERTRSLFWEHKLDALAPIVPPGERRIEVHP